MDDEHDCVEDRQGEVTGRVDLKSPDLLPDLSGHIHNLPCCIKHDGVCDVSGYFKPKKTGVMVEGLNVEEASFRGRKLQGTTIKIPEGYRGFILERGKNSGKGKDSESSAENCWEVRAKFEEMTYWNHDNLPSQSDAFLRGFHLFAVADALHKPVTLDDMASSPSSLHKK